MTEEHPDLRKLPRGTLAVILLYGALFVVGWLAIFVFVYLPRGAITR